MSLTNFLEVGTPRCGVPFRRDETNVVKAPFFQWPVAALGDWDGAARCPYLDSL
jgi:hypothetical protein